MWDEWREWIFDSGSGSPRDDAGIESQFDAAVSRFGDFYADPDLVPASATIRPNGLFISPADMEAYLGRGGLLIQDGSGDYIPNPIVKIAKVRLDGIVYYQAYIDEDTP